MSRGPLVFLDANVLFSAAIGGPSFELLMELAGSGRIRLTTSRECLAEAEVNLERKRPGARPRLPDVMAQVAVEIGESGEHADWAAALIHPDDIHVIAAARAAGADVLLTGDTTHFGSLMTRDDLGISVRTPRAFLLDQPGE